MSECILTSKSFDLSLDAIRLYYDMIDNKEFIISRQVLKSLTSIGANVRESKFAESTDDFIHKLKIAQKECNESLYWLDLIDKSNLMTYKPDHLYNQCLVIMKIICNTIKTCKNNKK